jgi:hypothetical protein
MKLKVFGLQGLKEWLDGAGVLYIAQGIGCYPTDVGIGVFHGCDEGVNGGRAHLHEAGIGIFSEILISESGHQVLEGRRAQIAQRLGRMIRHSKAEPLLIADGIGPIRVFRRLTELYRISESGHEGFDGAGILDLAQRSGRIALDAGVRVAEGGDEGLDGAGAVALAQRFGSLLANGRFRVLELADLLVYAHSMPDGDGPIDEQAEANQYHEGPPPFDRPGGLGHGGKAFRN